MTDILEILLPILSALVVYKLFFYISKRSVAIRKLSSLRETCGASVSYTRMPFLSFFKLGDKPDAVIETKDSIYLLRFIDTPGGGKHLHFASERFFVTYTKSPWSLGGLLQLRRRYRVAASNTHGTSSSERVRILPPMQIEEKYLSASEIYGKKVVPVLLFNPAPKELSYVTREKTSINVAFTGDEVYGFRVFTVSTFVIYVDRATREAKLKEFY